MSEIESEYDVHDADVVSSIDDLPLWSAPFGLALMEAVEMRRDMRVLDVGCGMGFPIIDLSQRLGPTARVYGIDPWTEAIARTRLKLRTWGIENVEIVEGVVEEMQFEDGFFDLVVSNNGTNNVDDEARAFAEIARVSAPGAQFVFTVNLPETMIEFYDIYRAVLEERGAAGAIERIDEHIIRKRKPVGHVREMVESAGFEIKEIRDGEFSFRFTDGTAMLNHFFIKVGFSAGWRAILDPEDVGDVFAELEARLNAVAEKDRELRVTVPWICVDSRRVSHL